MSPSSSAYGGCTLRRRAHSRDRAPRRPGALAASPPPAPSFWVTCAPQGGAQGGSMLGRGMMLGHGAWLLSGPRAARGRCKSSRFLLRLLGRAGAARKGGAHKGVRHCARCCCWGAAAPGLAPLPLTSAPSTFCFACCHTGRSASPRSAWWGAQRGRGGLASSSSAATLTHAARGAVPPSLTSRVCRASMMPPALACPTHLEIAHSHAEDEVRDGEGRDVPAAKGCSIV